MWRSATPLMIPPWGCLSRRPARRFTVALRMRSLFEAGYGRRQPSLAVSAPGGAWPSPPGRKRPGGATAGRPALPHQAVGALEEPLDLLQELGDRGAVDDAVVGRERDPHPLRDAHLPLDGHRLGLDRADRQDRRLRRVDDRVELVDVEHA